MCIWCGWTAWCAYTWFSCGLGLSGCGAIGCTNNNYASREKCKKCGQPKEVAAMPALAIPGASFPTYSHYFARTQGGLDSKMNLGLIGNGTSQHLHPLSSNWSLGGADKYGIHAAPTFPLGGNNSAISYMSLANQLLSVPKGWRNGDWLCNCGFHNYSSRAQVGFPPLHTESCFVLFLLVFVVSHFCLHLLFI